MTGVLHEEWGERPLAVVVLRAAAEAGELIAYARGNLATYKCPDRVRVVDALQRNESGKLLKPELRRRYGAGAP